ncbi:MAG: sigma-54-dependent Fis family transcriptional regulator [Myxococcales bacterium]|nr:sigma-54-dependent Fis family transcriptional regulator [Myxococcales bacterium]
MSRVLVVDDEENLRLVLRTMLGRAGYAVETAASAEEAIAKLEGFDPEFVLADVRMPGMSGLELCAYLRDHHHPATVLVMSAFGSIDLALEAIQAGAYDYVSKPFQKDEVLLALKKAEERERLRRENRALREEMRRSARYGRMIGRSEALERVFATLRKIARYDTTVLIQGESGTGKELVARALHEEGSRAQGPFVAINCGAIPDALLESELFGHKKGAFTDAHADRRGLFEEADGGTLFLDEIGELPLPLQVKLLRVLQEGTIRPLGARTDKKVNVRVVAATVRNLQEEVAAGRFREDLFYRLNVLPIRVPPLRERKEDIPLLVEHFVERCNARLGTRIHTVSPKAMRHLMAYSYPGNVRELENLIERSVVLAEGETLEADDLPEHLTRRPDPIERVLRSDELSIKKANRIVEETLIRRALQKTGGNRTHAAQLLEISHRALLYKIKDYGIA